MAYAYDEFGNPTSATDTVSGDRQCYAYDALGRLTSAWTAAGSECTAPGSWSDVGGPAPYWQDYTYTASGDRSTVVDHAAAGVATSTYTYPAAGGETTGDPTTSGEPLHGVAGVATTGAATASAAFSYDQAGNLTVRTIDGTTQNLTWDAEGKLTEISELAAVGGGVDASFVYTAGGDRLVRTQGGATMVYLPGGQEITASDGVVSVQRRYTFNGVAVAVRTGGSPAQVWSLVSDPHQSATMAINNAATPSEPVVVRRLDPWGNERGTTTGGIWPTDKGFLGKPVDASGLVSVGARYYDPLFARFISVDPVMNLADPNQWAAYAYANNNPVTNWDPSGLLNMRFDGGGYSKGYTGPETTGGAQADDAPRPSKRADFRSFRSGERAISASYALLQRWARTPDARRFVNFGQESPVAWNYTAELSIKAAGGDVGDIAELDWWASSSWDGAQMTIGLAKMGVNFRPGGPWDAKVPLGETFDVTDEASSWLALEDGSEVNYDVFGNVTHGFLCDSFGLSEDNAIAASHARGAGDDTSSIDDPAIVLGYSMFESLGADMTLEDYRAAIHEAANAGALGERWRG
ncbi:polymorphic toxin type 44 domain-containing protein [Actinotalea sp. M2MS4P-6]|uniref:RHS repeat-associated core domain-containing protein n=1 Tax=Actinotalea sp. M2MS4P-6 TaxID=2983762 RepID=UPI0021E4659C|nr:RHS repeat-associated core domain-containing protein [Actinotalea sp. M2MS4P-6]MCV2393809.1 polymorphic toxin type 44 domain-containing protein [Actinotalea sp. M2MS4P-6]